MELPFAGGILSRRSRGDNLLYTTLVVHMMHFVRCACVRVRRITEHFELFQHFEIVQSYYICMVVTAVCFYIWTLLAYDRVPW